jgi:hypothetical protein
MPLDHHIQMEQTRGGIQLALEQQRGDNALAVAKESRACSDAGEVDQGQPGPDRESIEL